ncbi:MULTISPECIES: ATP-binding protein [unclassified Undibacterium]|uniref:ATP-binding protein n=1 Tax=unclassified Undibacterium TaxID=2630295 RepID=UPI002AC9E1B2|nr:MULTISPECIES: ATP-binding protein [unclassified Undibacterium]MEB0140895.1 ATP-binding protein [Undibacterium sp. CCC2.1]MEB0173864.1 ATP-binding protein [Undibacterium sp. CCC1.1]MEB0177850.1 ATP-binding protein [Undibacterium sp. CCC3.4]MEB0217071.1 ATP-binding protein [Undibacterium sp. 5I2]WPX45498.1 ATP-binding protein [Undibacterium sp. CCC3.4]
MFHIKSLELVHWDYWQRIKNIPLDAKIITIAGQNGSGKTTLLDALRTLFGLECSMGRSYKHYARHSGQQTAWIRSVVDNSAVGPQISNRPFRMSGLYDDEVTLFCKIEKNGGDWKRQYLMRGGRVDIEEVQEAHDWLGVESYRKRLAHAGLSNAMGKVLALEQGETDKLCEYAPRQLLDLVFQVFGDKEVLDAYDDAKRHQRDTETELQRFETELEGAKTNLEGLRLRVANYHQYEGLQREKRDLQEEILPTLQYHEALAGAAATSLSLRNGRRLLKSQDAALSERRGHLAQQAQQVSTAKQAEAALEAEEAGLREKLQQINSKLKPQESLLEQKARLQKLAAEADPDVAHVADEVEKKEAQLSRQKAERDGLSQRIAAEMDTIAALQSKSALPDPENVRQMRRALQEAEIAHCMLPEIVEVSDPQWQAAVEGVLRGYTSVILLDHASDAAAAYRIGEKQKYNHFIVPDRVSAPSVKDQSLLSVVHFSAQAPAWLIEQLQRIVTVKSVEAGMKLPRSQEWITPEAYHFERRGGRSLFVEVSRYRFGNAGRSQRLEALLKSLPRLQSQEDVLTMQISKLAGEIGTCKARLAGVDAAKELAARHAEFDEAAHSTQPLKQQRMQVGGRLGELAPLLKAATEQRSVAHLRWEQAKAAIADAEAQVRAAEKRHAEERRAHYDILTGMRSTWHNLPPAWKRSVHRQALVAEHENVHQIELRIRSLSNNLARDDWEIDGTVVDQYTRLNTLLLGRQAETDERRYQNNRAIEATVNARAAYMDRLRYTIKSYSKNIKQLGELAGIEVHTDPVKLENDDIQLAQAGLHVRFKFDGKGPIGMNDGEASGGQQVMKSLILLIGLLKSEDGSGGFVFIDEPFAHLDIRNIQLVGEFLKNTDAQYLMTTPLTHNTDVYDPSELTLITSKKKKDADWAQPIFVLQRKVEKTKEGRRA